MVAETPGLATMVTIRRGFRFWTAYVGFLSVLVAVLVSVASGLTGLLVAALFSGPIAVSAVLVRRTNVCIDGDCVRVQNPFRSYELNRRSLENPVACLGWNLGLSTLAFSMFPRRRTWAFPATGEKPIILYVFNEYGFFDEDLSSAGSCSLENWLAELEFVE